MWRDWFRGRRTPPAGGGPAGLPRCRNCGGTSLKLSYRRRDESSEGHPAGVTLIYRCATCDGFTTVGDETADESPTPPAAPGDRP